MQQCEVRGHPNLKDVCTWNNVDDASSHAFFSLKPFAGPLRNTAVALAEC